MSDDTGHHGMSPVVKTVTGWLKPFILLFGIYIVVYGHLTPGGGFAGGVVIGCAFILLMLAEGRRVAVRTARPSVVAELDSVGALLFLGVGVIGLLGAGVLFKNVIQTSEAARFRLFSAGLIPVSNLGIGLKVAMSLFLVFLMISALRVHEKDGCRKMMRRGKQEEE
jgi:multicomponent Na+:H+ antiporter subunit B